MSGESPAEMMKNLRFDEQEVDTSAAQKYIGKYDKEISCIEDNTSSEVDSSDKSPTQEHTSQPILTKLQVIADKIKQNAYLFGQLEFLRRKILIEDVLSYDIKLIVSRFLRPRKGNSDSKLETYKLTFDGGLALAILGVVADHLYAGTKVILYIDDNTSPCAHLFVKICHEAGFTKNEVTFLKSAYVNINYIEAIDVQRIKTEEYIPGSVFVVTERSDLDSVVASIANATYNYRYPWRIRRVIVQENVYEQFDQILFETSTNHEDGDIFKIPLKNLCSKIAKLKGKIFIKDFTGHSNLLDMNDPYVTIESYRTTKELLSILNLKYQPRYLSIWCNDMSIVNEIGLSSNAENVWMNHFGNFESTKLLTYYDNNEYQEIFNINVHRGLYVTPDAEEQTLVKLLGNVVNELKAKRNNWIKLTQKARLDKINQLLGKEYKYTDVINHDEFVCFGADIVCYGAKKPYNIVYGDFYSNGCPRNINLDFIVEYLVNGSGVIIPREGSDVSAGSPIDVLSSNGIPVALAPAYIPSSVFSIDGINLYDPFCNSKQRTSSYKIVWMRFGETFAN